MAHSDAALAQLAEQYGIATEFWDWKGRHTEVDDASVIAVLGAMGVDASSPHSIDSALAARRDQAWRAMLPPVTVARAGAVPYVNLHVRDGRPARLVVRLEDGGQRDANQVDNWEPPRNIDGQMIGEATFQLPGDLPLGYHRLILDSDDRHAEATLIITPPHLAWPERMKNSRVWGYAAQLYSVRSRQSWGVGDFADLAALSAWSAAEQQADYVLINPVHAAESIPPMEPSPYLPTSRLFVNPIYVRPETVVEYTDLDDSDRARVGALLSSLRGELVGDDQIQRDKCWDHKRRALKIIWSAGRSDDRQMRFDAFRHHQGRMLRDFATWAVLCEHLGGDWRTWEPRFRHPDSPDVGAFRQAHLAEVDFHEWLQWVAAQAQSDAQETATDAGMAMGVITDLAVGVGQSSADVWMMQDLYAPGMTVGAPPDAYNQLGQGWGQPPWRPDRLEASAYAPFRTMVRNALGHAGGVRIDHIIGLFRLWWVPEGMGPAQGTYVRYDHEAMVGILALEAQRAGAVVIGEDLGTVEAWTRGYLAERGILGTSVLWFEEDDQGNPVPAEQWRALTMASVNTHDLPPTAGYLTKAHVALRARLGLLTEPLERENELADQELERWRAYLESRGALDPSVVDPVERMVLGLYKVLTWTPSRVLNATLVDAVGDARIQNQPGTVNQYPNWRVPLCGADGKPLLLEDVYAMERPMRLSAVLNGLDTTPEPWRRSTNPESRPLEDRA